MRALRILLAVTMLAPAAHAADEPVVVAGKDFTEQAIVVELTKQMLEAKGLAVVKRVGLTTADLHRQVAEGRVGVYWEYTATALMLRHGIDGRLGAQDAYARAKALDAPTNLTWLKPSRVNDTYALAMRTRVAEQRGIASISDLAGRLREGADLRIGLDEEFAKRPDGLKPLEALYGFEFASRNVQPMEADRVYRALRDGWVDLGLVYTTDGRVSAYDFRLLADDRAHFRDYIMVPVMRSDLGERHPSIAPSLEALAEKLDNPTMTRLNSEADLGRRLIRDVASDFLTRAGLR